MWAVPASGQALFASGSAGKFNSPGGVNRNDKDFPWLLAPTLTISGTERCEAVTNQASFSNQEPLAEGGCKWLLVKGIAMVIERAWR
jgi:hypothetical protein